jgi:lipopolysaccharide transport system permease protein
VTANQKRMYAARNLRLLHTLTKNDFVKRFNGTALGLLWALVSPLLLLIAYTFVFSVIFGLKWSEHNEGKLTFALNLFLGISLHNWMAESINRAVNLYTNHRVYVTRVIFPVQILPIMVVTSSFILLLINLGIIIITSIISGKIITFTIFLFPFLLVPLAFYCVGFAYFFSAIGAYIKDLTELTPLLTTLMLFLAPIFYPLETVPANVAQYLRLNPLTNVVDMARGVLFREELPDTYIFGSTFLVSMITLIIGYTTYVRLKPGFADVV